MRGHQGHFVRYAPRPASSGGLSAAGEASEVDPQQEILRRTSHFKVHRICTHALEDLRAVDLLPFESEGVGIPQDTRGLVEVTRIFEPVIAVLPGFLVPSEDGMRLGDHVPGRFLEYPVVEDEVGGVEEIAY